MTRPATEIHVLAVRRTTWDAPLVSRHALAHESGLHPDLVDRLIALGALEPRGGTRAAPLYPRDAAARLARVVRLRRDLGLNYAGALLADDLITRLDELEAHLERLDPHRGRK